MPPGDAPALHRAWLEILRRDDRVEAVILRARREVLDRFGQEQMIIAMADLYRRLAAGKGNAARSERRSA